MNNLIRSILATHAGYGITVLRIVTGLTFAAHGSQKLFGLFGGYGLASTAQWLESIGVTPAYPMAMLAGGTEFFGGLALIIGLLVRPAAIGLLIAMLVAIATVHWVNGFFITANGLEYAMTLGVIAVVILIEGAGKLSLDGRLAR